MGLSKRNSATILVLCFALFQHSTIDIVSANFTYHDFREERDRPFFNFSISASIDGGALQLTPDNENQVNGFHNKSGRIMYYKPQKLWLSDIDEDIASFNTTFVMDIYRNRVWNPGEGLAFVIAPDNNVPEQSYGQWMGLTNATTDGKRENYMVAIEFDTEKQDFDPDDNHIGLNINSVRSNKTVSLNQFGFLLSPENVTRYRVWIQYNGKSKVIEVYLANRSDVRPNNPFLRETINLKDHVKRESYFGFSASTGDPGIQFNCVLEWELQMETFPVKKDRKWLKIGIGIGVPGVILLVLFGIKLGIGYLKKRRRGLDEESNVIGALKRLPGMPREFRYRDLKKATDDFHKSMVLGQGGFGVVYRGVLREKIDSIGSATNTEVAVKKFSRDNIEGTDDFLAELTIIHRLRHKHLVRLVGWCYEKGKLLLVYDYMPNGSLEKHLYESSSALNWRHRYKILAGVASALHYLHNDYDQKVVHRDLKASNILLDSDFNARLGDFGLARAIENERNSYAEHGLAGVPGTMGYVAPECFHTGKATPESDVFGFGAVVLEVVCGRSPGEKIQHGEHQFTLVDWVWMLHREGRIQEAVDERLNNEYDVEEANRLLLLGLACSNPVTGERPQTQAICQIIAETLPMPHVPPFKPVFTWPALGVLNFSSLDSAFSNTTLSC
ncbi:Mitogen-activated protein kinase kinase kinase [Parasponia andersonii]|uniref:Mitogen-activated protein kinase kinase kinase n=1 Tax=Parasponia andersonii TaxID=3476 RepID=A0A2P5DPH5_PARAD|nr:Mitogen-activated protein kinase kinase kinase [Parasponia andersonii]